MAIWMVLFGVSLASGLFFLLADVLRLPLLATERAMLSMGRPGKQEARSLESILHGWAAALSRWVRVDRYRRIRMQKALDAAGMNTTPEIYVAQCLLKAGLVLLGAVPCLFVFPLLAPVMALLGILIYFKEAKKADEKLKAKRDEIERELPRFVATVEQELKASRDVLSILDGYRKNAGGSFAAELSILAADMRSSSYEAALTRFEARFNSPLISDVVRGLIGVLRGDDGGMYFQMLAHDMKQLELQRLKAEAMKVPPKIRVFSFVMLCCFLFTWLAIILLQILTSMNGMF